jgi:hypothetical protein
VKRKILSESATLAISRAVIQIQLKKKMVRLPWTDVFNFEIKDRDKLEISIVTIEKKSFLLVFRSLNELDEAWLVASKLWKTAFEARRASQLRRVMLISARYASILRDLSPHHIYCMTFLTSYFLF